MCGIAGIIYKNGQPAEKATLQKMIQSIRHRGPDGEGYFVEDNVGFGHCRLSIIDLTNQASQPMSAFNCTIVFNGMIYNYLELRRELEMNGYTFITKSDTEVLLASYAHWGEECVKKFNGMWAFAIFDPQKKTLFFSRDRMGEKPFYYFSNERFFAFASEIKALFSVVPSIAPNLEKVAEYLVASKVEFSGQTFFKEVQKLPAAHNGLYQIATGVVSMYPYYTPEFSNGNQPISFEQGLEQFSSLLESSIRLRGRSDVEIGSCLSGGLDSSSIVANLAQQFGSNVKTITATVSGKSNEFYYANRVAETCNVQAHFVDGEPKAHIVSLEDALKIQEEPINSTSVIMQLLVMQKAKQLGLKVLLDGQGADELLLGYLPHLTWKTKQGSILNQLRFINSATANNALTTREAISLFYYHAYPQVKKRAQLIRWGALATKFKEYLMQQKMFEESGKQCAVFENQVNEIRQNSLPMLLRFEDKNAMHFGVETRLPFLDPSLIDFCLNLPIDSKISNDGWTKFILRKYLERKGLPEIAWRKRKIGFQASALWDETWNHGYLERLESSTILRQLLPKANWQQYETKQIFRLNVVAVWEKIFFD